MWQALKALWGKITGQEPPSPPAPAAQPVPGTRLEEEEIPKAGSPLTGAPPTSAQPPAAVQAKQRSQTAGDLSKPGQPLIFPPRSMSTLAIINSLGAKNDVRSRIASIASSTSSSRAIRSIALTQLRRLP